MDSCVLSLPLSLPHFLYQLEKKEVFVFGSKFSDLSFQVFVFATSRNCVDKLNSCFNFIKNTKYMLIYMKL